MADYISCSIKDMTPDQLAAALLTQNDDGELGIRVVFIDACENEGIDCTNKQLTKEQAHKATIGLADCGKPALRIALPKGSFLNNVESYVDDAAAASGSVPVGAIYYNTTTSRLHVRMS